MKLAKPTPELLAITSGRSALMVDNYDSFTFNLVQYLQMLQVNVTTVRNDQVDLSSLSAYDFVIISPGPSDPDHAGQSLEVLSACVDMKKPLFGVCLGHQCIGQFFGGTIARCSTPMHGKVTLINHNGHGIYEGIPSPLSATRYHSLAVSRENLPKDLEITGESEDGVIQSFTHRTLPIASVQFHPESVLTEHGLRMLGQFIKHYVLT